MYGIKALLKETMDDIWFHISTFCDVKERGRLYTSHKHIHVNWKSLIFYHVGHRTSRKTFQAIITGKWHSLLNVVKLGRQLCLCSGKLVSLWSPWCSSDLLQLKSHCIQVYFKKSHGHAKFIYWIRRIVCAKYTCSLLHTDHLMARYKWARGYTIPVLTTQGIRVKQFVLSNEAFRVKLTMHDVSHRLVNCGYPKLCIQCFDFK